MPYLIDGHNLIPKLPHLSLQAADDEIQLVQLLQEFCRLHRKQVEVFFDNAPLGQPAIRRYGVVSAHFVRQGSTADQAIENRLLQLGRNAKNWIVVSSDQRVQAAARMAHARFITSEAFAEQMLSGRNAKPVEREKPPDRKLEAEEIADWLEIFSKRR
jgi:uncharacterized protein